MQVVIHRRFKETEVTGETRNEQRKKLTAHSIYVFNLDCCEYEIKHEVLVCGHALLTTLQALLLSHIILSVNHQPNLRELSMFGLSAKFLETHKSVKQFAFLCVPFHTCHYET